MRLHCLIYAAVTATPVIGISYDPKIDAFLKRIDQLSDISANTITADALWQSAEKIRNNDASIRQSLAEHTQTLKQISAADAVEAVRLL